MPTGSSTSPATCSVRTGRAPSSTDAVMRSPGLTPRSSPSLRVSTHAAGGKLHRAQLRIDQTAQLPIGRQPCQLDALGAMLEAQPRRRRRGRARRRARPEAASSSWRTPADSGSVKITVTSSRCTTWNCTLQHVVHRVQTKRPTTRMPTAQPMPSTESDDFQRRRARLRAIMRADAGQPGAQARCARAGPAEGWRAARAAWPPPAAAAPPGAPRRARRGPPRPAAISSVRLSTRGLTSNAQAREAVEVAIERR